MKTLSYIVLLSLLLLTPLFPANIGMPKLALFPLPHPGIGQPVADTIYNQIEENFTQSGRFEIISQDQKNSALREFNVSMNNIKREDALNVGRQLDLQFVGLYQITKNDYYTLDVEIIGIGYFAGQGAHFIKHLDDIKTVEHFVYKSVNYILERIFLVEVFYEQNSSFLSGRRPQKQLPKEKRIITTDNFFVSRKFFVSLNVAYNIPIAQYDFLDPFLYLDVFFDYSVFSTDYFVLSPYVEVNYFQHTSYVSATTQNILGCTGFSAGACFSVTFPFYRPVSIHLNAGCGIEASTINWEKPVSTDFLATTTLEGRYTFFDQLSVSAFLSYLFINYKEPVFHEVKFGTSVGYRF